MVRLLKPLSHYQATYGTALWGLSKTSLMLEKQHNRGQDGAGMACLKLDLPPGRPYIGLERVTEPSPPWQSLFKLLSKQLAELRQREPDILQHPDRLKLQYDFCGELYLGHVRYGTHGDYGVNDCHPVHRRSNWKSRNVVLAGNFNLTNVDELFARLVALGQHPYYRTDTALTLEAIGHWLDKRITATTLEQNTLGADELTERLAQSLDLVPILARASRDWDGGYALGGFLGHGDFFLMRDPNGIRPAFYYVNDEVATAASERPAIATAFNVPIEDVQELPPGHVLIVKKDGSWQVSQFAEPAEQITACSFERIYFSRGNDPDIYSERKELGRLLAEPLLEHIDYDLDHSVFSYIPNTSQVAFWGLLKALEDQHNWRKSRDILRAGTSMTETELQKILTSRVRVEYVILKDTKLRTFITDDNARDDMAAHVYDITYGTVQAGVDTLVCLDDSIVRGTTLRQSILRMLARLSPKRIVIVSSAPQIRYPDCYGIDMSQLGKFIAFQAAVELLQLRGMTQILHEVYERCRHARDTGQLDQENFVKAIYEPFTEAEISARIGQSLTTPDLGCEVNLIYQPLENLRKAIPNHLGDWYFSGDFPTPGGIRVVNQAYLNYYEKREHVRAY
jgi:amidophosphoribosyltransferase